MKHIFHIYCDMTRGIPWSTCDAWFSWTCPRLPRSRLTMPWAKFRLHKRFQLELFQWWSFWALWQQVTYGVCYKAIAFVGDRSVRGRETCSHSADLARYIPLRHLSSEVSAACHPCIHDDFQWLLDRELQTQKVYYSRTRRSFIDVDSE